MFCLLVINLLLACVSSNQQHSRATNFDNVIYNQCSDKMFWSGHLQRFGEHCQPIIGEVDEIPYMIGGQDFYKHYLRKRRPVVFRGAADSWQATQQWRNETYLREHYNNILFDVEQGKLFNKKFHTRKTMSMGEFLDVYKQDALYLDSPFPQSPLIRDLKSPLPMECEELRSAFRSMHLLFSAGDTSSCLHMDGYENLLTQFSGTKVVYMVAPEHNRAMYLDQSTTFPNLSPISPEHVDLLSYPKIANVPVHKVVLGAGDMVFIPQGWFHQVRSYESPNIAASLWFTLFTSASLNAEEPEYDYRDGYGQEEAYVKLINTAPHTIECKMQDIPLFQYKQILLPKKAERKNLSDQNTSTTVKNEEAFVNNTVLYDEVKSQETTIFIGSDDRWIYALDEKQGDVRWKVETAKDTGSVCAFDQSISIAYCGADDAYMRAIHISNGSLVWSYKTGDAIISSPTVNGDGDIFFGSMDNWFYALHADGSLKWRKNLNGAIWSSPVIYNKTIYVATTSGFKHNMWAIDMATGKRVWRYLALSEIKASPRINTAVPYVVVCDESAFVYALNTSTGEEIVIRRTSKNDSIEASPFVDKATGLVYILAISGRLYCLDSNMTVKWTLSVGTAQRGSSSSPLVHEKILYVASGNGTVYALDPQTGNVKWQTYIGAEIFFSSPHVTNSGVLVIGNLAGDIVALRSTDGTILWSVKTSGPVAGSSKIKEGVEK